MIDLVELVRYMARKWKLVAVVFVLSAVVGGIYFAVATPLYRAQITAQFQASTQNDGLSSTLGIGLALAGLQGDKTMPERARGFGTLKSRDFILSFVRERKLEPFIFPRRYDFSKNQWAPDAAVPSDEEIFEAFSNRVMSIDDNSSTGLITISIFLPDKNAVAIATNALLASLNRRLQFDAVSQANANLKYLNDQMTVNQVAEVRTAIAQLIQSEMRKLLLAGGEATPPFRVIDRATVPDKIYGPRALLVAVFSFLAALVVSLMLLVTGFIFRSRVT